LRVAAPSSPQQPQEETFLVVRVRRSAGRLPRILKALLALALTLPLALLWTGGVARAEPTAGDLQRQLRRLNGDADQAVERYLDAKLGLDQTRASLSSLRHGVEVARKQLDSLRGLVSAQAANAYMFGPADVALMLNPTNADDTLDRMQTLNLLAQRASDQLDDLAVAERAFGQELARLRKVEQQREAQVKRLAAEKNKVDQLVQRTQNLLAELRAAGGAGAVNGVDPGLPIGAAPPPPSGGGPAGAAVRYAYAQIGKPYVYGADGPGSFDCSGLTMMAWRQGGIALPHSAAAQYGIGRHVTRSELQPGDLIFRYSPISHVAIYVGGGYQIAATHTGSTVKLQSAFYGPVVGYSRPNG
jgi:cell wall-associated NlpC family hydrolase